MKSKRKALGPWVFLVGVVIAVILGLFNIPPGYSDLILAVLIIIGILIGFLNVTKEESSGFLLAGAVLILVSSLGQNAVSVFSAVSIGSIQIGAMLSGILNALLILFVPATIIVALRAVFNLAKN